MDYIRVALISALAIVSYLLLLAWNEDYPAQVSAPDATISETSETLTDLPADLPAAEPGAGADDIPEVSDAPAAPAARVQEAAETGNRVTVSTPVHEVTIDLRGGDIVRLALPRYPTTLETPDDPFVLLRNNGTGVYVAQSGLIGEDGPDASPGGRPLYRAARDSYVLEEGAGTLAVDLRYTTEAGVEITKRFVFSDSDYLIDVEYVIENASQEAFNANLFGQIKRDASPDPSSAGGFGVNTYLGAALTVPDDPYKKVDLGDIEDGGSRDVVTGGWIAFSQHYFLSAWIPDPQLTHTYTTRMNNTGEYIMGFVSPPVAVAPGENLSVDADFWAGPKDQYRLEEISPNLGLTIDYGWLHFIAYPIFWLLTHINDVIGNYGWSIIALTLVIKLLFLKLSASSYRSMAKMRRLTPEIARLRERHGDDKQKLMQAQMELWRKEKVNPMGGCLPMLLQMPVLIGIYWVLNESVELRHSPWILWYNDLSVMDPYFVLPLIMGASMYVSQLMTPMTTADPMQAKVMRMMPVLFTVFFLWFPAGLVLYWLVSNLFNIAQQWYVNRKVDAEYAKAKA